MQSPNTMAHARWHLGYLDPTAGLPPLESAPLPGYTPIPQSKGKIAPQTRYHTRLPEPRIAYFTTDDVTHCHETTYDTLPLGRKREAPTSDAITARARPLKGALKVIIVLKRERPERVGENQFGTVCLALGRPNIMPPSGTDL